MDPAELSAQRIADRGREAVLVRLRAAFADTAAAHSQLVQLDGPQLERMAQSAVDRAGGALWLRSLAEVAMTELEIPLAEAYDHPAVRRAQEILGVPAYNALARPPRVGPTPPAAPPKPPTTPQRPPPEPPPPEPEATPEPPPPEPRRTPPKPPATPERPPPEPPPPEPQATPEPPAPPEPADQPAPVAIRIGAVHLEGIETVRQGARNIELRFSDVGLDVIDTHDGEPIGRLTWTEIVSVELPRPRRSLRRRSSAPELIVTTDRGLARFELRGVGEDEAREHLAPVLARFETSRG